MAEDDGRIVTLRFSKFRILCSRNLMHSLEHESVISGLAFSTSIAEAEGIMVNFSHKTHS